jgi:4-amino-4-deoxy-L-arabinose transferase-like glycosyltransferase
VAWILATLVGHDPWKPDEAYTFGLVLDFLDRGDWVVPMLAGEPFLEKPPLFFITASAFAGAFGSVLPLHDAARLATGFYVAVALAFLALTARELYGRRLGWTAVLTMLGSLGLIVRAHQLITDVALFAGISIAMYGLACSRLHALRGGSALGIGGAVAFLAKGLLGPGVLGLAALALACFPPWRQRTYTRALLIAALVATPPVAAWTVALYLRSPDLFATWLVTNNFGRFLGFTDIGPHQPRFFYVYTLAWYALPSLPLAAWGIWSRVRGGASVREDPGILMPLVVLGAMLAVLGVASDARELYLMPTLLPLALLGALAADRLPVAAAVAVARTAKIAFGLLACVLWLLWLTLLSGWPSGIAQVLSEFQPDYTASFTWSALAIALAVTAAWVVASRTRTSTGHVAVAQWAVGATLCIVIVGTLWLPYIDAGKSYRGMVLSLLRSLPDGGCIASRHLGEPQRAMLYYYGHRTTLRDESDAPNTSCSILLIQGWRSSGAPAGQEDWVPIWEGARAGDDKELYRLYVSPSRHPAPSRHSLSARP